MKCWLFNLVVSVCLTSSIITSIIRVWIVSEIGIKENYVKKNLLFVYKRGFDSQWTLYGRVDVNLNISLLLIYLTTLNLVLGARHHPSNAHWLSALANTSLEIGTKFNTDDTTFNIFLIFIVFMICVYIEKIYYEKYIMKYIVG